DGPTAEHVRSRLEVDGIERPAPSRPVIGAAPEKAQARRMQRPVVLPHHTAFVQLLSRWVEFEAAAFEQQHRKAASYERSGQCDACRTSPRNAHVGLEPLSIFQ